jgi:homocysteine S-methyltransferase
MGFAVVDGGLSTALEAAGHDLAHPLWTARLLVENPTALRDAHLAYLQAGAGVILTASYQASREGLAAAGATDPDAVLASSTALARAAVAQAGTEAQVAASVGPYGAVLADGSEYRGRYHLAPAALARFHCERLEVLLATTPDLLAVETLPTAAEAAAVVTGLRGSSVPAWFAFTCADGARTWGGDRIEDAVGAALAYAHAVAIGVNCTAPELVSPLLERIRTVTSMPLVVYPNHGRRWDGNRHAWLDGPGTAERDPFASLAHWLDLGAAYVGGCCGIGPDHIARLACGSR